MVKISKVSNKFNLNKSKKHLHSQISEAVEHFSGERKRALSLVMFKFRLCRTSEYALLRGSPSLAGGGLAAIFGYQRCCNEMFPGMIHRGFKAIKHLGFCWYNAWGENICDELSLSKL